MPIKQEESHAEISSEGRSDRRGSGDGADVRLGGFCPQRAHIILPSGECIIVGSEKSVTLPDGSLLDLRPETTPADEIGTTFAAQQGNSRLEKGPCP